MKKIGIKMILSLLLFSCSKEPIELKPVACFDFYPMSDINTGDTIVFTNCSENFTINVWDFGDGDTSAEISPKHMYNESGTYKIIQTIKNIDLIDTISEFITINSKYLIVGQDSNKTIITKADILLNPWQGISIYNLDLNSDNITDLEFSVENIRFFAGSCLVKSEIKVKTNNDNIKLIANSIYLDVLNYGDKLEKDSNWGKDTLLLLRSTQDCGDMTQVFEGYWKDVDEKFIGFMLNNKSGWIKAGLKDNSALYIYEYALGK